MKGALYITRAVGKNEVRHVETPPKLKELQQLCGGYIQQVPGLLNFLTEEGLVPCVAFCDEDGKYKPGPLRNDYATARWAAALGYTPADFLVGTVVIITGDEEFMKAFLHEEDA